MIGETFLISVSPNAIEKTTRFFNASLRDTLIELLQNSRRAGATRVDIALDGNILSLSDDGCGIFRDRVSISLGESGWDDDTQVREDAAGCGIFSLAQRGCTIEANGYRLLLDSDRFCGRKPVAVESGSVFSGTRIAFPLCDHELERVRETVRFCTRHYPVPVFLGDEPMPFTDFLAGLAYRESWNGLEIGVSTWKPNSINFYGLVVGTRLPVVNNGSDRLTVLVDVEACSQLKLVLPQCKEVVLSDSLPLPRHLTRTLLEL